MRILRFEDPSGNPRLGTPLGDGRAAVLRGDIFDGLEPTAERLKIAKALPPLDPVNIFCIGLNYLDHAAEAGFEAPEHPILFMKPTTATVAHGEPVRLPDACSDAPEVDYEGELAIVIGRRARDVNESDALSHVLGYTCANDISARRWQKNGGGRQWVRGKSFDTFCPLGPVLVTADEIPDPQVLRVRTWLNGALMQDGITADMIFSVARLVSFISRDTTLLPGTVILSGTPPGVGFARKPPVFLAPGDQVAVEIDGIGRLENPVTEASG